MLIRHWSHGADGWMIGRAPAVAVSRARAPTASETGGPVAAGMEQASVKGEDLGRAVIGTVGLATNEQMGDLKPCSESCWQSQQFPRHQPLGGRPAYGQADAGVRVLVITAPTAVAAARAVMSTISRDGDLRQHHLAVDEGQAHPEPQQYGQEQNARPMPGPVFHGAPKMAL